MKVNIFFNISSQFILRLPAVPIFEGHPDLIGPNLNVTRRIPNFTICHSIHRSDT